LLDTTLLKDFQMTVSKITSTRFLAAASMVAMVALLAASGALKAQTKTDPNTVLAKGPGIEVKQADIDLAEEEIGAQLQGVDDATKREQLLAYLIDMKIVAKAAEDKKLGDSADFKRKVAFARERLLMDSLLASEAKTAVTDAEMKKIYDEAAKQIASEEEVHARHILVETEDEAKAIIAELKKGGDFAAIAKAKSKDPGGSEGGDLGFFTKGQMVPEFSEAAFKLAPGSLSDPVKSQFGWHVIKVEEKRNKQAPSFDQVKPQIEQYAQRKAQAELVTKLRDAAKVERTAAGQPPKPAADAAPAAPATPAPAPAK
jgi:peptidyl-prolyl cis-trans isomerase C